MACVDIGEANADIAGVGVVTSFAFQAIASFLLAAVLESQLADPLVESPLPPTSLKEARTIRQKINRMLESMSLAAFNLGDVTRERFNEGKRIVDTTISMLQNVSSFTALRLAAHEFVQHLIEDDRLDADSRTSLLAHVDGSSVRQQGRKIVADILYSSSDTQTLAGIALALTGIVQHKTLNLYQFHLVYDTINLTRHVSSAIGTSYRECTADNLSVSNCAALAGASAVETSDLAPRIGQMFIFTVLYLVFSILFGKRLSQWDYKVPGLCYDTSYLAVPGAQHPYVDKLYLGFTCFYMLGVLSTSLQLALSRIEVDENWSDRRKIVAHRLIQLLSYNTAFYDFLAKRGLEKDEGTLRFVRKVVEMNPVLTAGMIQLPLHLYFIIRIRLSNEPLLANGKEENQWGFGQIFALFMSASLLIECFKGYLST